MTSASLGGATTTTVTITPDTAGLYELTLVVGDGAGTSDPKSFSLRVVGDVVVPLDYPTVAEAVFASWDGGTILLAPGTHVTRVDLDGRNLTFVGSDRDTTFLDAEGKGRTILARRDEDVTLQSLTLRNGVAGRGGNLYGETPGTATFDLVDVTIEGGRAGEGGNVYLLTTDLAGENVRLVDGLAAYRGGGLMTYYSNVDLDRSLVAGNRSPTSAGGGLRVFQSNLRATNVVFHDNLALYGGAVHSQNPGTYVFDHVTATLNEAIDAGAVIQADENTDWDVRDSLFASNFGASVVGDSEGATYVQTYTMAQDNEYSYGLESTLTTAPVDGVDGNLVEGNYDASFVALTDDGDWSNDDWNLAPTCDAIDAANPASLPDVDRSPADMGAHGGPQGVFDP